MRPPLFLLPMLFLLCAARAEAGTVVLTSSAPYWQVGVRDNDLSRACSLDVFGPSRLGALVARFTGPEGAAVLDVAKGSGSNLRDLKHVAKPSEDYFFRNAGTTSCEVLVGGRGGGKPLTPASR
jgi:hypothetical protein